MRGIRSIATAALLAAGTVAVAASPAVTVAVQPEQKMAEEREIKRMRKVVAAGTIARQRRSRGPQAKPKKRPNRAHIGKRVRRKHRRAA